MSPEAYLDELLSLPGLFSATISPDGKYVAWVWVRTAPTCEVYIAPTDGSSDPIRMTDTPQNTYFASWAPDSSAILVMQDTDGDERFVLYRVDIDTPLKMTPLTDQKPDYFLRGGYLHPNGRWLVYGANYDFEKGAEIEQTYVYRHDLQTGERLLLAKPEKSAFTGPELSPTGDYVVYRRADRHPSGRQVWLVDIEGQQDREIFNGGDDAKAYATFTSDGKKLVIEHDTDTHKRIGLYNLQTGDLTWLIDDSTRNIEDARMPAHSQHIVVLEVDQARTQASLLNPETGEETALPYRAGNLIPIGWDTWDKWIGVISSSVQPADIVKFSTNDLSDMTSISNVWSKTKLKPNDLTKAEDFRWNSVDGLEIQGWLYRTTVGQARGTIVYVHGGPTHHSRDAINNEIQYYVRQGFNVLDPNYRGSTGFSMAFREKIKEDGWGGKEQDDIHTGMAALINAGIAERGKIGMTGTSYGGYSSWCGITRFPPDILKASAPVCGMTDLVVDYHTTRPDLRPYSEEMLGGSPDTAPERYYERSPINFVGQIQGKLLIVQGMQDPNVSPENVNEVTRALQANNIEYNILAFDDEGHGISKPKNQKVLYQELAKFFDHAFNG